MAHQVREFQDEAKVACRRIVDRMRRSGILTTANLEMVAESICTAMPLVSELLFKTELTEGE